MKHILTTVGTLLCLLPSALAQTPIPPGATALLDPSSLESFSLSGAPRQILTVEGQPFAQAFRVVTGEPMENFWDIELGSLLTRPVERDGVALLRFYARAEHGHGETNDGIVTVYSQRISPPWEKSITIEFTIGREWTEFLVPYQFAQSYAAGTHAIVFGFGHDPQTIDIGGIELFSYADRQDVADLPRTVRTYPGQEAGAAWRIEALRRIDQHRKDNLTVEVLDPEGNPVEGAEVAVSLTRHSFPFGTVVDARRIVGSESDDQIYREKLLELFSSTGTENDLKWPPWVGDWGSSFDRDQTLRALRWMREHFVYVRGHVMVWPGWDNLPHAVRRLRDTGRSHEIPALTLAHIDDIAQETRGLIDGWDVLNEPYANSDLMDLFGNEIMVDWFQRARQNLPEAELFLNDYGILSSGGRWEEKQNHFLETARFLLENDAGLSGLGLQSHFGDSVTPPVRLLEVLDRVAALGLPIHLTEFDINTTELQLQADYTRDFYIAAFSHPAVELIQMWGFWEGQHWCPDAALYATDWTEKPNGAAYRKLMEETFHTRFIGSSDVDGRLTGRGFLGTYRATARTADGRTAETSFELRPGGSMIRLVVRPGPRAALTTPTRCVEK